MELNGYVARWRGDTYQASAAMEHGQLLVRLYTSTHADGFTEVSADRFVRTVPPADLDGLLYVQAVCKWRGVPFCVLARDASDAVLLEYAGGSTPDVEQLGLAEVEHGVYRARVQADQIDRIEAVELALL
jgi:hypothetical protein